MNYFITALISLVTASLPCIVAIVQMKNETKKVREQHEVNIEEIREQHRLELVAKEEDFEREKKMIQLKHDHELELNERKMTNAVCAQAGNEIIGQLFQSPQIKDEIEKVIQKNLYKNG